MVNALVSLLHAWKNSLLKLYIASDFDTQNIFDKDNLKKIARNSNYLNFN